MTPTREDDPILGRGERTARRFRFSIRGLMILIVVLAGVLAWSVQHVDQIKDPYLFWPAIPLVMVPASGWVWSIRRIYKNPTDGQKLSIVVLVGSVLWTVAEAPFVLLWLAYLFSWQLYI